MSVISSAYLDDASSASTYNVGIISTKLVVVLILFGQSTAASYLKTWQTFGVNTDGSHLILEVATIFVSYSSC